MIFGIATQYCSGTWPCQLPPGGIGYSRRNPPRHRRTNGWRMQPRLARSKLGARWTVSDAGDSRQVPLGKLVVLHGSLETPSASHGRSTRLNRYSALQPETSRSCGSRRQLSVQVFLNAPVPVALVSNGNRGRKSPPDRRLRRERSTQRQVVRESRVHQLPWLPAGNRRRTVQRPSAVLQQLRRGAISEVLPWLSVVRWSVAVT